MTDEMRVQIEIRKRIEAERTREATKPRIGPRPPRVLPEAPNKDGY